MGEQSPQDAIRAILSIPPPDRLKALRRLYREDFDLAEACWKHAGSGSGRMAIAIGKPESTRKVREIRSIAYKKRGIVRPDPNVTPPPPEVATYTPTADERIRDLTSQAVSLQKERIKRQALVESLAEMFAAEAGSLDPTPFPILTQATGHTPVCAMLEVSDWQDGSAWNNGDSGGFGEMSSDIVADRVQTLTTKVVKLVDIQRKAMPIPNLAVNMNGDMCEGEIIYPSQGVYIDQAAIHQYVHCAGLAERMLRTFLSHFETVTVRAAAGNHGRMSRAKGEQHALNNWDYLLYLFLAERFRDEPRIKFFISTAPWMGFTMPEAPKFNHVMLHGDNIPSSLGIPWYGIKREAGKLVDLMDMPIHYMHIAHFHSAATLPKPHGKQIMNGSLTGTSPLAAVLNTGGDPSQTLLAIHPDEGIMWTMDVRVAPSTKPTADANGIITPYTQGIDRQPEEAIA